MHECSAIASECSNAHTRHLNPNQLNNADQTTTNKQKQQQPQQQRQQQPQHNNNNNSSNNETNTPAPEKMQLLPTPSRESEQIPKPTHRNMRQPQKDKLVDTLGRKNCIKLDKGHWDCQHQLTTRVAPRRKSYDIRWSNGIRG